MQGPSDSESLSDSSISGAEETQNEADETNQDDLTSSSPPTSPSPVESDKDKGPPLPIPVESTISGEKLAELPRPEPQHPSPGRQPIVSSPLNPSQLPIGGALTSVSSHIPQGFVPLPPLPAFQFRQQYPPLQSESLHPLPPVSNKSQSPSSSNTETKTVNSTASTVAPSGVGGAETRETTVISLPKVKEEVLSPPQSPKKVTIKQEPRDSVSFMSNSDQNVVSARPMDGFSVKDICPLVTPKIEPGTAYPSSIDYSTSSNQGQIDMTLTPQAQVKGLSQKSEGDTEKGERSQDGDRSEVEVMSDSEPEMCGTPPPEPDPIPCNIEIRRTASAMLVSSLILIG